MDQSKSDQVLGTLLLIGVGLTIVSVAAWATHIYVCFKASEWGFLLAGALAFPVAVVHGVGIWFGFW